MDKIGKFGSIHFQSYTKEKKVDEYYCVLFTILKDSIG